MKFIKFLKTQIMNKHLTHKNHSFYTKSKTNWKMRKREREAWGDEIVEASVWDEDGEWDRTLCDNCKTLTPIIFQLSKNTTKTNRSRDWNMRFFFFLKRRNF
jgi:hypothetical protein